MKDDKKFPGLPGGKKQDPIAKMYRDMENNSVMFRAKRFFLNLKISIKDKFSKIINTVKISWLITVARIVNMFTNRK